jgi:hypothetical protein
MIIVNKEKEKYNKLIRVRCESEIWGIEIELEGRL